MCFVHLETGVYLYAPQMASDSISKAFENNWTNVFDAELKNKFKKWSSVYPEWAWVGGDYMQMITDWDNTVVIAGWKSVLYPYHGSCVLSQACIWLEIMT